MKVWGKIVFFALLLLMFALVWTSKPSLFYFPFKKETLAPLELPVPGKLVNMVDNDTKLSTDSLILPEHLKGKKAISCDLSWTYKWYAWDWKILVPDIYYEYFTSLERPKTDNYAIYVIHPFHGEALRLICAQLESICKDKNFNETQKIEFYASFVSSTKYFEDSDNGSVCEYPKYPIETLCEIGGDCEDKSILLASLLSTSKVEVALIELPSSHHMLVGVAGDTISGEYFVEESGNRYYALDVTNPGWGIGGIAPKYRDSSLRIRRINSAPIILQKFRALFVNFDLQLTVMVENIGNADATDLHILAGFDASNNQLWNPQESSLFNLLIGEEKEIILTLRPPYGKNTRLIVHIIDDSYIIDTKYSEWRDL